MSSDELNDLIMWALPCNSNCAAPSTAMEPEESVYSDSGDPHNSNPLYFVEHAVRYYFSVARALQDDVDVTQGNQAPPEYPHSTEEAELLITTVHAQHDMLKAQLVLEEGWIKHNQARANYHQLQIRKAQQHADKIQENLDKANQMVRRARMVISDCGYFSVLSVPLPPHPRIKNRTRSKSTNANMLCFIHFSYSEHRLTAFLWQVHTVT